MLETVLRLHSTQTERPLAALFLGQNSLPGDLYRFSGVFAQHYQDLLREGTGVVHQTSEPAGDGSIVSKTLIFDGRYTADAGSYIWQLSETRAGERHVRQLLVALDGLLSRAIHFDAQGRVATQRVEAPAKTRQLADDVIKSLYPASETVDMLRAKKQEDIRLAAAKTALAVRHNRTRAADDVMGEVAGLLLGQEAVRAQKCAQLVGFAALEPYGLGPPRSLKARESLPEPSTVPDDLPEMPFTRDTLDDDFWEMSFPLALRLIEELPKLQTPAAEARQQLAAVTDEEEQAYSKILTQYVHGNREGAVVEPVSQRERLAEQAGRYEDATATIRLAGRKIAADLAKTLDPLVCFIGQHIYWIGFDTKGQPRLCTTNETGERIYFNRFDAIAPEDGRMATLADHTALIKDMQLQKQPNEVASLSALALANADR